MIAYCGYHSFYYISSYSFNCISMSVFLDGMMGYVSKLECTPTDISVAFNKTHTKILRQNAYQNSKTIPNFSNKSIPIQIKQCFVLVNH